MSVDTLLYNHAYADLINDPASLLTLAGCWVTPFPDDAVDEEDYSIRAWQSIQDIFPDIALGFSWAVWEDIADDQIDRQLIREIETRVPGVFFDIDHIPFGPIYNFYGIDWGELSSRRIEQTPETKRLKAYGQLLNRINDKHSPYDHDTITHLTETLWKDQPEVSAFIQWMCHWSGNTLFDMTYDDWADNSAYDQFDWTIENVDFAWYLNDEARTFVALAEGGQRKLKKTETFIQFCEQLLKSNCLAITEVHHVIPTTDTYPEP